MTDLERVLRERYAERRAIAEAAPPWPWQVNPEDADEVIASDGIAVAEAFALSGRQTRATAVFIATNDPAHVLADLASKVAILDEVVAAPHDAHDDDPWYSCATVTDGPAACIDEGRAGGPCDCGRDRQVERRLRILARPFVGHVECKGEWAA